jgi:signal peptidase I
METSTDISPPFQAPASIKPRDPKMASLLAKCCAGLGHIYAGDIRRGLLVLAGVDLPLAFGSLLIVAPWGNLKLGIGLWFFAIALAIWSVFDVRKVVLSTRSDYRMKDYNHWIAYLVIGFVPSLVVAVAAGTAILTTISESKIAVVDQPQIGIERGDRFIEWKAAYRDRKPAIGDRIVYRGPLGSRKLLLGRVIGLPGDVVITPEGQAPVPQGSLGVQHTDGVEGRDVISEMAVSGKLVHRFWPLHRFGAVNSDVKPGE